MKLTKLTIEKQIFLLNVWSACSSRFKLIIIIIRARGLTIIIIVWLGLPLYVVVIAFTLGWSSNNKVSPYLHCINWVKTVGSLLENSYQIFYLIDTRAARVSLFVCLSIENDLSSFAEITGKQNANSAIKRIFFNSILHFLELKIQCQVCE